MQTNMEKETISPVAGWMRVFDQLEADKHKLLRQELTISGKKMVFEKEEMVFFLGNIRCILTNKGWKFEV